jgi:hypothetical protein
MTLYEIGGGLKSKSEIIGGGGKSETSYLVMSLEKFNSKKNIKYLRHGFKLKKVTDGQAKIKLCRDVFSKNICILSNLQNLCVCISRIS